MTRRGRAEASGALLGAARAESDREMLNVAFVPTADFQMLQRGPSHNFVVGRRGAGKSALFQQLVSHFKEQSTLLVLAIRPEEFAMKGLLSSLRRRLPADASYSTVRAIMRVVWRSALLAHVAKVGLSRKKTHDVTPLRTVLSATPWVEDDLVASAISIVKSLPAEDDEDGLVYSAAKASGLEALEGVVRNWLVEHGLRAVVLVDGLDEGWQAHDLEVGTVGGLCAAAVELRDKQTNTHVLVFLRDNIFRTLGERDADFSRNIAGDNLRLTWDHDTLFDVVVRRLRAVHQVPDSENGVQVWNRFAKRELEGKDGFIECLKHTLYRPRDALELLNTAFQSAARKGRREIVQDDISNSALEISKWRLNDLFKEYEDVLPGLQAYVRAFSGRPAIDTLGRVLELLELGRPSFSPDAQQTFAKLGTAENVFQSLFGVGFLGLEVSGSGFQFCHDGTDIASKEVERSVRVAVHPCYYRALDVHDADAGALDVLLAVNDDYDEEPSNQDGVAKLMAAGAKSMVDRLMTIPMGHDGAGDFEKWVLDVVTLLFSDDLSNIELHPNRTSPARRDVVGANEAKSGLWRRMLSSYRATHVIFEAKNFDTLGSEVFLQSRGYMGVPYGNLVFVIYRSLRDSLDMNERSHIQQHFSAGQFLIVLVPASQLQRFLEKRIRQGSAKYARRKFAKWVDQHERVFVNPQAGLRA